jgi:hypothetical protein
MYGVHNAALFNDHHARSPKDARVKPVKEGHTQYDGDRGRKNKAREACMPAADFDIDAAELVTAVIGVIRDLDLQRILSRVQG